MSAARVTTRPTKLIGCATGNATQVLLDGRVVATRLGPVSIEDAIGICRAVEQPAPHAVIPFISQRGRKPATKVEPDAWDVPPEAA